MSIGIIYASSHGTTETCAEELNRLFNNQAVLFNLKHTGNPDISRFDTLIIGGSIHAGQLKGKVKKFYQQHLDLLLSKRIGLFICCMEEGGKMEEQFNTAYPRELREHAIGHGYFGGEFILKKMNFLQKAIVKKIAKIEESVSKINYDSIKKFAELFK